MKWMPKRVEKADSRARSRWLQARMAGLSIFAPWAWASRKAVSSIQKGCYDILRQ